MILYCKITKETAVKLGEALDMPIKNANQETIGRPRKVIRWGVGNGIGYIPALVVNKKDAVNRAINKSRAIELFNQNGVRTAQFTTKVPCVGRTAAHTQGQNFWLCWQKTQIQTAMDEGAEYFIDYIPIKQEYRVHVMDGEFKFAQRKYPHDRVSTAFMGVQGFSNGWHKTIYTGPLSQEIKQTAINAVVCLGLDFGGVDILVSLKDNLPYVAEVNTGPALPTDQVLRPYVDYFRIKLGL